MTLDALLGQILLLFGLGFLIANVRVGLELLRWRRRRTGALVVWPAPKPPFYAMSLGIGVLLGLLILLKAYLAYVVLYRELEAQPPLAMWLSRFGANAFGELMMFVYFGYMLPFSTKIARGLYADGLWTDTGFMRYEQVGGVSWRDGVLVVISRRGSTARRLTVPSLALGELRRHLRDKISSHDIEIDEGPGIHLGARDARDSV